MSEYIEVNINTYIKRYNENLYGPIVQFQPKVDAKYKIKNNIYKCKIHKCIKCSKCDMFKSEYCNVIACDIFERTDGNYVYFKKINNNIFYKLWNYLTKKL